MSDPDMLDDMADVALGTDAAGVDGRGGSDGRSRRVAPIVVAAIAVVLGLLFWVLLSAGGDRGPSAATPLLDQPAPAVVGAFDDGTPFELSRRKGSWVVLNFFTHNCIPCIREHPELIEFVDQQRGLGSQGAEFYSIVQTSTRNEVEAYFAEHGGDWPIVYDERYDFQLEFGVVQVPETWIIDPNGVVRGRWIGEVDADLLGSSLQLMREQFGRGVG